MGGNIIITPSGGLGNRLRAIESSLSLCNRRHGRLLVIWQSSPEMVASYGELFQPHPDFRVLETKPGTRFLEQAVRKLKLLSGYHFVSDAEVIASGYDLSGRSEEHNLYINTCNTVFRFERNFDWINPINKIDSKIREYRPRLTEKTIGVHVRRTDNQWSVATSTDERFFQHMDAAINADEDVSFFLFTDCEATEKTYLNRYGSRIFARRKQFGRSQVAAVQDALVDWILLSECRKIFHSHWSSFSFTAAFRNGSELIEIK